MGPDRESSMPDAADPLIGRVVGHFRVLAPLGRGGMGVVYRAEDVDLWREVALKVLPPHWADDGDRRASFLREARSAAAVAHANVATVYEVGTAGSTSFIAMELVRGPTLRDELARGVDHARALSIAIGVTRGLARAHEVGVLHLDLKPENVMIDREGEAKILDFGLARALAGGEGRDEGRSAGAGTFVGTLGYMSPEQARGEALDARSDVFALGILLFELFTGERPFASGSPAETLVAVVRDEARSLATSGAPAPLVAVVDRCLARDPDARFPTASAARDALLAARPHVAAAAGVSTITADLLAPALATTADAALPRIADLPSGAGAFHGRRREIEDVIERFDAGVRLVTIVGPGGIGKTRTAREIARRLLDRDRRPAIAVALGATRTAADALQSIAGSLGAPPAAGVDPMVTLGLSLRTRGRMLLVLDEADAVAAVLAEPLSRCLAAAPEVIVLVTSRVRLRASSEELVDLGPLDPSTGAALFLERARAVRRQLREDDATLAVAREISERLDGSPLAIELAAARVEVLAPHAILDRLGDRLRLLTTASGDGRHASMRAVLEWSWSLLDVAQRSVLAQLSVFRGGASADAAEAIIVPPDRAAYVIDVLQSLHASSLLRVAEDDDGGARFTMYESVRLYAEQALREDLADGVAWRRACGRHAAWFAARARDAWADSSRGIDARGDRWLARERDNVVASADRAIAGDGAELDDGAIAVASLGRALYAIGGSDAVRARIVALTARAGELAPAAAADLLVSAAILAGEAKPEEAYAIATRAVELTDAAGDPALAMRARSALCWAFHRALDYAAAARVALEAVALARAAGLPHLEESALADVARAYARLERIDDARVPIEAAITSARARGARRALPELELVLGFVCMQRGDLEAAARHERAALDGAREVGLDRVAAVASVNIGGSLHALGRHAEAREHFAHAIERLERRGEPLTLGLALGNAGFLEHELGELVLARSRYDRAIELLSQIHERRFRALFQSARGALFARLDRMDDAVRDLEAAEALARSLDERGCRVAVSLMRGHLELARARGTVDPQERAAIVAAVRAGIVTVSTPDAHGAPLAERADVVRAAAASLGWVLRADYPEG